MVLFLGPAVSNFQAFLGMSLIDKISMMVLVKGFFVFLFHYWSKKKITFIYYIFLRFLKKKTTNFPFIWIFIIWKCMTKWHLLGYFQLAGIWIGFYYCYIWWWIFLCYSRLGEWNIVDIWIRSSIISTGWYMRFIERIMTYPEIISTGNETGSEIESDEN